MLNLTEYFIANKYTKLYEKIIKHAVSANRKKRRSTHRDYVYYELHHIVPASVAPELSNLKEHNENGALLTAREHFLCHYLLCKMVPKNSKHWHSLVRAFTVMFAGSHKQSRYVNSRLYDYARRNIGRIMSDAQAGELNSQFGTVWVSHLGQRKCIKINKSALASYLSRGYIQKRIINWDKYEQNLQARQQSRLVKRKKKVAIIDRKIADLLLMKQKLLAEPI